MDYEDDVIFQMPCLATEQDEEKIFAGESHKDVHDHANIESKKLLRDIRGLPLHCGQLNSPDWHRLGC